MMTLIIIMHVIACIILIGLVLIQRGRGGGLVESFSGVESMFGTKTSAFLTRSTTVLSIVFFVTCLSLAVLSIRQSRSLMRNVVIPPAVDTQGAAATESSAATQATAETKADSVAPAQAATGTPIQASEPVGPGTTAGAQAPFTQVEPEDMQKAAQTQQTNKTEGATQNK